MASRQRTIFFATLCIAVLVMSGCSKSKPADQNQSAPPQAQNVPPQDASQNASAPAAQPAPSISAPPASNVPQAEQPLAAQPVPSASAPPPAPVTVTIPQGRTISVIVHQTLSSATSNTGSTFEASLAAPISVNGTIVIPKGAIVTGMVVNAVPSGRLSTPAELAVRLKSIVAYGTTYKIASSMVARKGKSHKGRNTAIIGGSAVGGAVIGGLLGGGKGAAIGAVAGGGGGVAGAAATGKTDITIAAETRLNFTLRHPLAVALPSSQDAAAPSASPQ
jgi:hypothetical protein